MSEPSKIAVVTGASAGIGAATVTHLARAGFRVFAGARRVERVREVTEPVGGVALPLDVTDPESIGAFVAAVREGAGGEGAVHVLVNNAGGALGLDSVADAVDERWRTMWETNVLGTMRLTRAFLDALELSGDGLIVSIGSIAGFETYPGGAGYTAAKHGQRALTRTLRLELLGKPIRVTEIAPGLVETEFSLVRFDGDSERAEKVYAGMEPLLAEDIADCVAWVATRPAHVNIDEMIVRPRDQAAATLVHRRPVD
jgi:NADP-dependent 3-hydroxy acid dehydrogenase YdfG